LKRILLLFIFSFALSSGAFAQKYPFNPPQVLSTVTITCATMTLVITSTDLTCNGNNSGIASVSVSGGTGPYLYDWQPSGQTTPTATGLGAGTPSVEVTDALFNTCIGSISITEPAVLNANINLAPPPQVSCFGLCNATATVTPNGGTSPYTYAWNTAPVQTTASATGLCAGSNTVTVTDANGCIRVRTFNIIQPTSIAHGGSSSTIQCFGVCTGSASVSPTGGVGAYTYAWSTGAITSAISALCAGSYTATVRDANSCSVTYITTITEPTQLSSTVTGANLICNAVCTGSVSATAAGGTGAHTYSWAPGGYTTPVVTGLCAGTYTLTLRDANSCAITRTVTLTQPVALTAAPGIVTNISCFNASDGVITANAGGGTGAYTYSWAPGGCNSATCSNLASGTYTLTLNDANSCAATATVTLVNPAQLVSNPTKTDVVCPGLCNGTANAGASGGTVQYTYSWSTGATTAGINALCQGTYTITVRDANNCVAVNTVNITMPSPLLPNVTYTTVSCFGACDGAVNSATTGGSPPYTYAWAPGGCTTSACAPLCAADYTLTLSDANGCTVTSIANVTQPAVFTASIAASPNPLNCNGDCNGTAIITPNGGTAPFTYSWSNGATTATLTGLCAGGYTLSAVDAKGCTTTTTVTFTQPVALTVTVTPTNQSCSAGSNGSITASASGGTGAYTYAWLPGNQTTSSITGVSVGNYTVTVSDNKGCSNTQTVSLTAPSPVSAGAFVISNVSCSGDCDGVATANPTGGTGAYTYLWNTAPPQTTQIATGLCSVPVTVRVRDANGCQDIDALTLTQPNVLLSIVSSATSSCNLCTGAASVSTSGGTAPYDYSWAPGGQTTSAATGLCIGTYTVDITDANGCANTVTVSITSQINVVVSSSGLSVSCPGSCDGSATATPSGGGNPYTYSWTPGVQNTQSATGLCAGNYTVNVTDATGCTSTNTVSFSTPALLTTTMSSTTASCGLCNGTASVAAAGGTGALTYSWSGFPVQTTATATGLCFGNYSVTVSDANNCTTTNTVTVGNIPAISNTASTTLSACGGSDGAICVSPSGGVPAYTYSWAPGGQTVSCITGLAAGIYTVTISDAGCSSNFLIGLGNLSGPTVTVTFANNPSCNLSCNGSIGASAAGNSPFTYLWSNGQTTTSISALCAGSYVVQVTDNVPCSSVSPTINLTNPPQLIATPSVTNVSCGSGNDGSICLSPSAGTAPYTFTWSSGQSTSCISGLTAGTYTVILADANGCDDTISIPVTAPALLTVTITSTNVACSGTGNGTATAVVSGGTTLYTYLWSTGSVLPGVVGLSAGNYSVTVTDNNGCIGSATVAITEPVALTTTISSTNITCNSFCDGVATLAASGGTGAYTYSWLPGGETTSSITGLCPGNYAVTATDASGCTSSKTVAITVPAVISTTVTPTDATCFGGCNGTAIATSTGGTGAYTYSWNPGALTGFSVTGLCANSYVLTTTDANGCVVTSSFNISSPSVLQAGITSTPTSCTNTCDGTATASPLGGTGAYTFLWSNGQTTITATGLCATSYTLTLSDANGCTIAPTTNIASPPALTQASSVTGATCLVCNGDITVIGSGGTPPYSYFWSTGATTGTITGLCAGIYIDTLMDANGCISVDTISVSNTTGPVISLTGTNIDCFGGCNGTATVATVTGNGPPWIYSWSFTAPTQTTQTATGLCANQYFASVSDISGCVTIDDVNITEPGALAANASVTNASCFGICNGSISATPTGGTGAYTYAWLPGGQTTNSITGQCAGNYTLTLRDANNCSLVSAITIGQNTILTSTLTSTNNSCNAACNGTASITIAGGTFPYTYLWNLGGQTTTTATGLCAGNYTITVNDNISCMNINTVTITEPGILVTNAAGTNPLCSSLCNGTVSAVPGGGTAPYTYSWMPGNVTTSSVSGLCPGTYTLTLRDANNCVATSTVTLTDPAPVTASYVVTPASCTNTCDGIINITPSGGTTPYTYTWSNGKTTEDVTGLCAGNYSVTIRDANACAVTYTMTVNITTLVVSAAGNDTSYCAGGSATLRSTSTNATAINWYQLPAWTSVGSTNPITVSPPAGVTTYALIAMNGICSDTDSVVVTVNSFPVVVANNTTICSGSSASICASGASTYQWYQLPAWTPITSGSCINVSPAVGATNYAVVGMNGLCSDTASVSVTVFAMPVAIASNDTAFCTGGTATLKSSSTNATAINWYQLPAWSLVGSTSPITVTPPAGITTYALVAMNGICSDTDTVVVTVNNYPVVIANNTTICSGSSTSICASGASGYQWYQLPAWTPITSGNCINVSPAVGVTNYAVVGMNGLCSDTDSVAVTVLVMPVAAAGNDTVYCTGGSATLCGTLSQNGTAFAWYALPAWTKIDSVVCTTVSPLTTTSYALIVSNGICSDTDIVVVTVYPSPIVDAGPNVTIIVSTGTVLNGTGSGTYLWTPSTGLSSSTIANPTANPTVTTTYTLTVTDAGGCSSSDSVRVTIVTNVIANDGLSPNGDGLNDVWTITSIEQFPNALVEVYNRWGELLFSSIGYSQKWDATYKGKELPVGTYYYVINLNSALHPDPITGPITILR